VQGPNAGSVPGRERGGHFQSLSIMLIWGYVIFGDLFAVLVGRQMMTRCHVSRGRSLPESNVSAVRQQRVGQCTIGTIVTSGWFVDRIYSTRRCNRLRLARANMTCDNAVVALAASGELDLLQCDYPGVAAAEFCGDFLEQLRTLHKHFFLDPDLRLITNAGGGNVVACVEALGEYLREHGDAAMPITAVRGDNLLHRLSDLAAAGVEFNDETTGQPLLASDQRVLAAQVELGAGPLAAAWDEGSRMIVAGCYDGTAPFVGAAKTTLRLGWNDYDPLAGVAVAAHAAQLAGTITETNVAGEVVLLPADRELLDSESLLQKLRQLAASDATIVQADVVSDISSLALAPKEFGGLSLDGVRGTKPSGSWRMRLTFEAPLVVDSPQVVHRWAHVPRDAVNVSVDTRPAADWL
jgi:hypothetical protein